MLLRAAEWVYPILQMFQKQEIQFHEAVPEAKKEEVVVQTKKPKEEDDPFGFKASRAKAKRRERQNA
jgi:hypothetical protein